MQHDVPQEGFEPDQAARRKSRKGPPEVPVVPRIRECARCGKITALVYDYCDSCLVVRGISKGRVEKDKQ